MKKTAKKEKKELKEAGSKMPASNSTVPAKSHTNSTGKSSSKSNSKSTSAAQSAFIKKYAAARLAHLKAKTASKSFTVQGHELATIAAAEAEPADVVTAEVGEQGTKEPMRDDDDDEEFV